jgi:predicted metalloprotease with PDZ domain
MERLRSKAIEPFNFEGEDMSGELWFGEGFTNYYGPLIIRRAGFYTDEEYLSMMGGEIIGTINSPARLHGSPVDMSHDAVFFDGAQYLDPTNRENIFLSYYTWGSIVAMGLDLTLRERFDKTLDDYMRLLWREYGKHQSPALAPTRPYTLADLRSALQRRRGIREGLFRPLRRRERGAGFCKAARTCRVQARDSCGRDAIPWRVTRQ